MNTDASPNSAREFCPNCGSDYFIKYGHTHNKKQNHRCKKCGREFILDPERKQISDETKELIKKTLLERIPLRGICRVFDISLSFLLDFMFNLYTNSPDHLNIFKVKECKGVTMFKIEAEVDELCTYVQKKANKQWVWLAIDNTSRQIIAFYVGDRSKESAKILWSRIPDFYKEKAIFYTDEYASYVDVIPSDRHFPVKKGSGKTNHIERFNCTLRQRISRLVRKTLSFSKKLENLIGAIKYFICDYNLNISLRLAS